MVNSASGVDVPIPRLLPEFITILPVAEMNPKLLILLPIMLPVALTMPVVNTLPLYTLLLVIKLLPVILPTALIPIFIPQTFAVSLYRILANMFELAPTVIPALFAAELNVALFAN